MGEIRPRTFGVRRLRALLMPLGALSLLLGCVLAVAACGGSSSPAASPAAATTAATATTGGGASTTGASTTGTPTTGTSTTAAANFTAYRSCLTSHGMTTAFGAGGGFFGRGGRGRGSTTGTTTTATATTAAPTGTTPGASGRPALSAADQKALAACASLRPTGGFGGGFGGGGFAGRGGFAANPKFEACLKSHGVQTGAAPTGASSALRTAFAACRSLLPSGGAGFGAGGAGFGAGGAAGGGGGAAGANSATFAKYQACLKAHGVQPGAAGQSGSKLQAAITACRSVLSSGAASAGSTQTTTTG